MKVLSALIVGMYLMVPMAKADTNKDIFAEADALFDARENDRSAVARARDAYTRLLDTVDGEQAVYAVSQLGRLAIYEGEMLLPKTATAERRAIFQDCWCKEPKLNGIGPGTCNRPGFVNRIKTVNGREHPAYYYFRGACMAYWMETASALEKLAFVSQLESTLTRGPSVDYDLVKGKEFEGGGLYRIAAGVHSNPIAGPLGQHKPEEAMTEVDKALAAPASIGDPNAGARYFGNHQMKAGVFIQLHAKYPDAGWQDKGIEFATHTLEDMDDIIDFDTYPTGRKPEFMYNYQSLKAHYKTLTGGEWGE